MGIKIIKPPIQDTYIKKKWNGKCSLHHSKYFCSQNLLVGKDCRHLFRTLIKFDLSSLPSYLTIINGTLNLRLIQNEFSLTPKIIQLHKIVSGWNEKKVSFSCQPLFDPAPLASVTLRQQQNTWISWGLTPLIQNWYSGMESNLGILLKTSNECFNDKIVFASKEFCNANYWPYLEIDFLDPAEAPDGNCCQPLEITFHVFTEDTWQCTDPLNTLMFNYTYYVVNTGDFPAQAYLQTSADGLHWGTDSSTATIAPNKTEAFVPNWITKYSKLCYQSAADQNTSLSIYVQGRS